MTLEMIADELLQLINSRRFPFSYCHGIVLLVWEKEREVMSGCDWNGKRTRSSAQRSLQEAIFATFLKRMTGSGGEFKGGGRGTGLLSLNGWRTGKVSAPFSDEFLVNSRTPAADLD